MNALLTNVVNMFKVIDEEKLDDHDDDGDTVSGDTYIGKADRAVCYGSAITAKPQRQC